MSGFDALANEVKVCCPHCQRIIDLGPYRKRLFSKLISQLEKGVAISVRGFGTFRSYLRPSRISIIRGVRYQIPPRRIVHFSLAEVVKDRFNAK